MVLIETEERHIPELVRISKAAFDSDIEVGASIGNVPPNYNSEVWHKDMMRRGNLFTAIVNEKIIGAAIVFPNADNGTVYIGRIFVDPVEFRKGYGIAIMNEIESMYPDALSFNLDTPEWNARTNVFYKKLGYREQKREDGFVYYEK